MNMYFQNSILIIALISLPYNGFSQFSIVLIDSYKASDTRIDLSELIIRYGETEAGSAF
jgi:hypothetical protein